MKKDDVLAARDAVVEAARAWYASAGNAEANLAAAMQRLLILERKEVPSEFRDV
jgi:hypothetical protein